MKTLRAILGYTVAGLGVPIVIVVLMLLMSGALADTVVGATGLTIAPEIDGGEVAQTIEHGLYRTEVHRMVFDGFFGEQRKGFVQVDWTPLGSLPTRIEEEIDADGDGRSDFRVRVDAAGGSAALTPLADWVTEIEGPYTRKASLAVRVHLRNPAR
jgi:hypothetical protein